MKKGTTAGTPAPDPKPKTKKIKIKTIDVKIYEWFDKTYGNSYFAGYICINYGMETTTRLNLGFQYGYGSHSEDIAFKELQKYGYIKNPENKSRWQLYKDLKIIYRYTKIDNCKKRDLMYYND